MLTTLLLVACPFALSIQDEKPTEEQIASICQDLATALAGDKTEEALLALHAAQDVVDARVIELIDKQGLRHDDPFVRDAAIEALGRMQHPDALKALHDALKRDRKALQAAPTRYAALLRAIARHGQESSISYLVEDPFQSADRGVITARILGLANIRSPRSVDELIRLMRSSRHTWEGAQMPDFRLALMVLTGADMGTDRQLWINWYGDHKAKIEIAAVPPELPRELRKRWNSFWGLTEEKDKGAEAPMRGGKGIDR